MSSASLSPNNTELSASPAQPPPKPVPWYSRSWLLLLICGTLIGVNFPLAKVATAEGVSPVTWVFLVSLGSAFGAGLVLLVSGLASKSHSRAGIWPRINVNGHTLRYALIAGPLTFAAPNLLGFSVLPHTGAGYAGLMFALSPVATLTLSALFRMKTTSRIGVLGIAVGMSGAILISYARAHEQSAPETLWLLLAFALPLVLAAGNVYRTLDWPADARPDALAFWSYLFATLAYAIILLIDQGTGWMHPLTLVPSTALMQLAAAIALAPCLFRLQQLGGPVLLSQIGYVAAAVSLGVSTLFLNEQYNLGTWVGAAVIAVGIAITVTANRRSERG